MRGRFLIILSLALMLALLVALNAASYVRVEREADLEGAPDRSTSNAGATGTRALYEFLEDSGYRVARWRETPGNLSRVMGKSQPAAFVIVGPLRRDLTEEEAERLLSWVDGGGRLVVIDREPATELLPIVNDLRVAAQPAEEQPAFDLRADNLNALTSGVSSVKPAQPTLLTNSVEQIMPTRFASRLYVHALSEAERKVDEEAAEENEVMRPLAPVLHFTDERGALVADFRYGRGRIVVLSEPFIVANNGIRRADNLQLAVNLLTNGASRNDAG
ncbi:MAG: DUF4350 domain-containing protein, partial [Acidobacteriota bacterium]|nr:DUF4350 domain-containing protein [Acidobacteriota bacterium]